MHSRRSSVIIVLIILTISILLLIAYSRKQGEHTFSFIKSLYNEIRGTGTSVRIPTRYQEDIQQFVFYITPGFSFLASEKRKI